MNSKSFTDRKVILWLWRLCDRNQSFPYAGVILMCFDKKCFWVRFDAIEQAAAGKWNFHKWDGVRPLHYETHSHPHDAPQSIDNLKSEYIFVLKVKYLFELYCPWIFFFISHSWLFGCHNMDDIFLSELTNIDLRDI